MTNENTLVAEAQEELAFCDKLDEMVQVFLRKHHDYGPKNIAVTGDIGIVVRMADKIMRLVNMRIDNPGRAPLNESIDDAFMDLAVYGIIALLCREGKWPGVKGETPRHTVVVDMTGIPLDTKRP